MLLRASKRSSRLVELANRSIKVLNFVSVVLLSRRLPRTHPQVSFGRLEFIIVVGTFDSSCSLVGEVFAMTSVGLGKVEKGFDSLLV